MKNVLIIGSQHGNELLGEALFEYVTQHRSELLSHITYMIGNIKAKKANVRYIDSDLNRSYNGKRTGYEERRASRIMSYIHKHAFDLVLDMHTTTCEQPPCLIIPSINTTIVSFLRACSIKKVVHMNHDIVKTSLIGVCPQAVSIEVNKRALDNMLLEELCNDLSRYIHDERSESLKTVYQIGDLLKKTELSESEAATLKNFHKSSYGFYPVLVGENSYKKQTAYLGFKAYKVYQTRV
jgi:succinylglutamate desuccinylase